VKRISLTPAVFHLSDRVNRIALDYAAQPIVPRGPALKPILDRLRLKVAEQLEAGKTHETIILTASGSGAIAAAVGSCVDNDGILVIANDVYGHRQASFCKQLGIRTVVYELEPGVAPSLEAIEQQIHESGVGCIGMVHGCTSVGLLNPVEAVGRLAKRMGKRLIVDAIASVFVEELHTTDWHIDVLIGATNKGLHSNPDLCFVLVARDLLETISKRPGKIPYLDLYQTWSAQRNGSHPYTINIRALLEFEAALDDFCDRGGLAGRLQMYRDRLNILRPGFEKLGLKSFFRAGMAQQNIGTALYLPDGVDYDALASALASWDNGDGECYEIYSAQGELSGKVFRIFNMGEYPLDSYQRFLSALGACIDRIQADRC
jgi:2-aminoethylphosphonate-pyruvate transaminase